jgi:orotate phosphoribosyltransferase
LIDGYVPTINDHVSIVDDVGTTGGSLRKIAEVVTKHAPNILAAYIVVKRGEFSLNFPLKWLFTVDEIV